MQCQSRQLSLCLSDDRPTDRLYIYTSPIPHNVDYIINLQKTLIILLAPCANQSINII